MRLLIILVILGILVLLMRKRKTVEGGYWGPWGYSTRSRWVYPNYAYYPHYIRSYYPSWLYYPNIGPWLPFQYWL